MDQSQKRVFVAVGLLLGAAIATSLLGSVLPESLTMLTAVPSTLLIGGLTLVLGVVAVSALRNRSAAHHASSSLVQGPPPERPQQPPAHTGAAFDTAIADAARDVRVKQVEPAATAPREQLRETAIGIIATGRGCTRDEADDHVSDGDWTTDPVARSFLSEQGEYPFLFRVFWWARPELAYERAATRTITELHARAEASVPGYQTQADRTTRPDGDVTASTGLVGAVRARLVSQPSPPAGETAPAGDIDTTAPDSAVASESDEPRAEHSTTHTDSETPPVATPGGERDE